MESIADTMAHARTEPGAKPAAVALLGITKRYPGVVANDDISLTIHGGEVHALLGENGAGKSTLIGVLSGMVAPDAGTIAVHGRRVRITSPRHAIELGIGTVYQHTTLVPTLTVLQNLMLGSAWWRRLDARGTRRRLAELSATLGVEVDPDALAGKLALGQQQQVEIIKALWRGEDVLILDEPTSMLTPQGVHDLGNVMARLKESGIAIIFITHKLNEAVEFGDRISVLRRGKLVGELTRAELADMTQEGATNAIVRLMFGGQAGEEGRQAAGAEVHGHRASVDLTKAPVLEVADLSADARGEGHSLKHVSFAVRPGEVFGIAGIDGNGQKLLAEAIAGQRSITAGDIRLGGESLKGASVGQRQHRGLRYVTDDRLGEGTVASFSVSLNMLLKRIGEPPFWRHGVVRPAQINDNARRLIERHDIRTPSPRTPVANLSGGNVQKTVLARELAMTPKVVVYNKPTYGLDIMNIRATWESIRSQAGERVAAVVISNELVELLVLCDRIGVMLRGELVGIVDNGPEAEARIGELMVGAGRGAGSSAGPSASAW